MIVTLPDGRKITTSIQNCTGYVAKSIELEPRDCDALRTMLSFGDIRYMQTMLLQLKHRFESERASRGIFDARHGVVRKNWDGINTDYVEPARHDYRCPALSGGECRCVELGGYV